MNTPEPARLHEIFAEASLLPPDERAGYLDRTCRENPELRKEVESLLAALARRPQFLSSPTNGVGVPDGSPPAERPGSRIGVYKLLEEIGHGGFGTVFMAEQEQPVRRRVALKIIRHGMDTHAVIARFEAERQALAMMDHPHIAQVLDAGASASGRPYFVMELVRGESITAYADRNSLSISDRLDLFVQVCLAVQHAHSKGVIHRDLKPGNILVATQDGRPHAKVIDFGIAKATHEKLTQRTLFTEFNQLIGTPEYMSPEQAGGAPDIDTRSDVYSLGTLLYELLTGATPIDAKQLRAAAYDEMRRIIREVDPPLPSTRVSHAADLLAVAATRRNPPDRLAASISGDLDWIVMKAIEKDRARRYQTAGALADDILRHLAGDPVAAAPPSVPYRFHKFVRRHRALVIGAALVTAALVLGFIGTSWGLISATHARKDAQAQAARAEAQATLAASAQAEATLAKSRAEYDAYIANIESAYTAMHFNDTTRLRTRLEACLPELRNWEWKCLSAASDASSMTMTHPSRFVVSVASSHDGSRLISSSIDGIARLWNPATGVEIASFRGPSKFQGRVDFSPDASLILAAADDGRITIWDAVSHAQVALLSGHSAKVTAAHFIDNARIVSASEDGSARTWDIRTAVELRRIQHEGPIHRAVLNANRSRLATASRDQTVRLWDFEESREPMVLRGHTASVVNVRWSADGSHVASASYDSTARVWNSHTGAEISSFHHDGRVAFATFSPDATRVVSAAHAGSPSIWDATTGKELAQLRGHTNSVLGATFSPDDRWILTNSRDNTVRLWDSRTGSEWSCLRGHIESPWIAEFMPTGQHIVTCGDTTVRLWPIAQDSEQSIIQSPWTDTTTMHLSPDGQHILETGNRRVRWIDVKSGLASSIPEITNPSGESAISPDGSTIWISVAGNSVQSWDVSNHTQGPVLSGHSGRVHRIALDAQSKRIVTASEDGTARVWDASTGHQLLVLRGHGPSVNSAEFDPSGTRIVTAGRDKSVRIWDAASGDQLLLLAGHESAVQFARWSADGSRILSTSADFSARIWNATSADALFVLRGHEHVVFNGGFSPDGSRIATSSMDGTVRIWDAANGRQVLALRGKSGGMTKAHFTADGTRLFYADTEGRAWLLDTVPTRDRRALGFRREPALR